MFPYIADFYSASKSPQNPSLKQQQSQTILQSQPQVLSLIAVCCISQNLCPEHQAHLRNQSAVKNPINLIGVEKSGPEATFSGTPVTYQAVSLKYFSRLEPRLQFRSQFPTNCGGYSIRYTMADLRAPPTPLAMIIGTAIIAAVSGYMIGIASSLGFIPIPFMPKTAAMRTPYDDEEESEEEDIDASILDHAPNWANGFEADKRDGLRATASATKKEKKITAKETVIEDIGEPCKMVLVVRTDLGMTKG
jgi:hypothetical protein